MSTGPEQSVSLHVRTHHTLLQGLDVAVQRRAAGAHLATGTLRIKPQCVCVCESRRDYKQERLTKNKENRGTQRETKKKEQKKEEARQGKRVSLQQTFLAKTGNH